MAVLALLLCLPAVSITWLGYRLLEQDRVLEKQRILDSREANQAVLTRSAILADRKLLTETPGGGRTLGHQGPPAPVPRPHTRCSSAPGRHIYGRALSQYRSRLPAGRPVQG